MGLLAVGGVLVGFHAAGSGTTRCTLGMVGANVAIQLSAPKSIAGTCATARAEADRTSLGQSWYLMPALPGEPVVCRLRVKRVLVEVEDTGGQFYGQNLCQYLERAA